MRCAMRVGCSWGATEISRTRPRTAPEASRTGAPSMSERATRDIVDARIQVRMREAERVEPEAEDLLPGNFRAAIKRRHRGRAEVPLQQKRIRHAVLHDLLTVLSPRQQGRERTRAHRPVEPNRGCQPRFV